MANILTPSQEEQSNRSLDDEKLSDETPSEGGRSSGLPRAGAGALIRCDGILQSHDIVGPCASQHLADASEGKVELAALLLLSVQKQRTRLTAIDEEFCSKCLHCLGCLILTCTGSVESC